MGRFVVCFNFSFLFFFFLFLPLFSFLFLICDSVSLIVNKVLLFFSPWGRWVGSLLLVLVLLLFVFFVGDVFFS